MKWVTQLIILSLLVSMAGLSRAVTGLVDPTRPANYIEKSSEAPVTQFAEGQSSENKAVANEKSSSIDLKLHAIKIGRTSKLAIINGETLRPGQTIGPAKLIKIDSSSVLMEINGKPVTVSLLPDTIKKRALQ